MEIRKLVMIFGPALPGSLVVVLFGYNAWTWSKFYFDLAQGARILTDAPGWIPVAARLWGLPFILTFPLAPIIGLVALAIPGSVIAGCIFAAMSDEKDDAWAIVQYLVISVVLSWAVPGYLIAHMLAYAVLHEDEVMDGVMRWIHNWRRLLGRAPLLA